MLEGGFEGSKEVRAVREREQGGAREGRRNQLLLIHNVIKIKINVY